MDNIITKQNDTYKRYEFIDIMRGIGILCVCLGHCIGTLEEPVNRAILSFHMPLFFFISGMLINVDDKFNIFLKKRFMGLIVPQIILGFLNTGSAIIIDVLLTHEYSLNQLDYRGYFSSWFLLTLFAMELVLYFILKVCKHKRVILILVCLVFFCIANIPIIEIFHLQRLFFSLVFGLLGFIFKPLMLLYEQKNNRITGIGILFVPLIFILSCYNIPVAMYMNQYGNTILFMLFSVLDIFIVFLVSIDVKSKIISYFGKNSLCVYLTHAVIIRVLIGVFSRLFSAYVYDKYPFYLFCFGILFFIEIPVIYVLNKAKNSFIKRPS